MKSFPINLKKFKKIASDKEHTTLRAPEGHEIKVKHSALQRKMRDMLSALPMADGGEVEKPDAEYQEAQKKQLEAAGNIGNKSYGAASGSVREAQGSGDTAPASSKSQKDKEDFAKGASQSISHPIQNLTHPAYADGGPVDNPILPQPTSTQMPQAGDDEFQMPTDAAISDATTPQAAAGSLFQDDKYKQAILDSKSNAVNSGNSVANTLKDAAKYLMSGPQDAVKVGAQDQTAQLQQPPNVQQADQVAPPPSPAAQSMQQSPDVNPSPIMQGINEERQGLEQQYKAGAALAQGQQAALQNDQEVRDQAMGNYQARAQALDNERQGFVNDLQQGHIDPQHYLNSMGTAGHIATNIGLLLGGMGAGLTGGPNYAMQKLQANIDRDIDAQKTQIGVKQNLLSANLRQFGNLRDATDMTRVMQNDAVSHQMQMAAAKAGTQAAYGNYLQAKGALDQKSAMLMATLGARQTINSPNSGQLEVNHALNVLRMVDPAQAKEVEARYVPGVGIATVPVPQEVRSQLVERNTLSDSINRLIAFQKKYGGTMEGIADPTVRNAGEALAKQVQDQYRRGNQQGVFKESEAKFVNGVIADSPSSLFSKYTKLPGYRMAAQINQGNLNQLKSAYGLKTPAPIESKPPILPKIK